MKSRREFLIQSGVFFGGIVASHSLFPVMSFAEKLQALPRKNKKFVFIFLRGAMDGLSFLVPEGDPAYFDARKKIVIQKAQASKNVKLDSFFALHPSLAPLKKYWDEGTLALIPQSGSPFNTRSHFDAQDFIEGGTLSDKNIRDGFLNRALAQMPTAQPSSVRAVALQSSMPRSLQGAFPAVSMTSLKDFRLRSGPSGGAASFEQLYAQAADQVFRGVGGEIVGSLNTVEQVNDRKMSSIDNYPKCPLGKNLSNIASLINGDVGLQVAVTEMSGWDTHINQGNEVGQLSKRFEELAGSLKAFVDEIGPRYQDVVIHVMTEFGRTVKENGTSGTDHGHGSVMMTLGGSVRGKRIIGKWTDLSAQHLYEGRDVPINTDYRLVLSEVLTRHLGLSSVSSIFPGYVFDPRRKLGIIA